MPKVCVTGRSFMTEADSYDEADEGEETRVVIQYRRSTKVAGKGS